MTVTAIAQDLRDLPDGELAAMFTTTDAGTELGRAILAECARQDRRARSRAARDALRAEWESGAYSQYLAACEATNGYLLSKAGKAAGISEYPGLWTGTGARAMRLASEELREFWYTHPRVTVSHYARQAREARRIARDEADLAAMPAPCPPAAWDCLPGGARLRESWVRVNGERRPAWWRIGADGTATLHPTIESAARPAPSPRIAPPVRPAAPTSAPQPRLPVQVPPRRLCAQRGTQRLCLIQRRRRQAVARHECNPIGVPR